MKRKFNYRYNSADTGDYRVIFKKADHGTTDLFRIIRIKYAKRPPWHEHVQGTEASRLEDDGNGLDWIRAGKDTVRINYSEMAELLHMLDVAVECDPQYMGDVDVTEVTKK